MALLKKDNYVLYAGGSANLQTVEYGTTKWAEIDFDKNLMLSYTVGDTTACSAVYTATDLALKFYVDIESEVYVVQLLKDGDTWTATKVDSSSVYVAPWGLSLQLLNAVPTDTFVYTKDGSSVYLNSYRSDTEWRFTQVYGDLIREAVVTDQGWTVNTRSIGGSGNILVVQYGDATHALSELSQYDTVLMQMNDKTFYLSELSSSRAHFATSYAINGKTQVETCDYDGSSWGDVEVACLDKVSVDSTSKAGYLDDVLVSDSDLVSLVNADGKLHVQVNTAVSYDPKIQTLDEFAINTATSNYGGYALASGYSKLEWQNPSSYSYLNAIVFQSMRIATSQGVITKCNLALTGNLSGDAPCFNVALFSTDGILLGSTGLVFPKETGASDAGNQLLTVDMTSAFDDALNLKRNTRYIIQVWSCGCQLAAYSHGTTYNYGYDYTLRQNMQTTTSTTDWVSVDNAGFSKAETIPYISFGASEIA